MGIVNAEVAVSRSCSIFFLSILSFSLSQFGFAQVGTVASLDCPPITVAELKKLVSQSPTQRLRLVFFSSWCSDCAGHLKKIKPSDSLVVIGAFDKRERIEKVVTHLKLSQPCYTDAGVGKLLKVTVVPAERVVDSDLFKSPK